MHILKKIVRKLFSPYNKIIFKKEQNRLHEFIQSSNNKKRAFIFGSPGHSNMGDQAQTFCIQRWIRNNYDDYISVIFTYKTATDFIIKTIRDNIQPSDKIFFHSGYHLTDLYPEKNVYCKVAEIFPDYKIVVFPQTINFVMDKNEEKRVADIFNNHGNISLLCRDAHSYKLAQTLFNKCRLLLFPDIVTSLIGTKKYNNIRDGVLFCFRNDVEAFYSFDQKQTLVQKLSNYKTEWADTTISILYPEICEHREQILEKMIESFSRYRVVITDRYHGTIFSLIANTPVIVINSTDHKLRSGVKWFPDSFMDFVYAVDNLDEAYDKAIEILSRNNNTNIFLPDYFEQEYYSKLKLILEDESL